MTDIGAALVKARLAMKDPRMSGENPHFRSKFVPRDEVLDAVIPALLDNGLFLSQGIFDGNMVTAVTQGVTTMRLSEYPIAPNPDPQKYLAACTYASRGSLMLAFALAGEQDDDGNTAAAPEPKREAPAPDPDKKNVKDPDREKVALLSKEAEANGKKAEFAEVLGNPKSLGEAVAAYKALSVPNKAKVELIAGGAEVLS